MIEEDTLYELYWEENFSMNDIADELNCGIGTVQHWMNKYGIDRRNHTREKITISEDSLRKLYCEEDLTMKEVGDELGYSKQQVHYWMEEHDIKRRSRPLEVKIDEETLREYYVEKEWSQKMIGEKFDCSRGTIRRRIERFGIEKRSHSECLEAAYEKERRKPKNQVGNQNPFYGKNHSNESKKKQRKSAIKRIERNSEHQVKPNYNPQACKVIEEYGEKHGYNFQHAENGGEYHIKELGYWVDGYDKEQNVVIEVDEAYHYNRNGELQEKDKRRQKEIEEHLGCEFIRVRIDT